MVRGGVSAINLGRNMNDDGDDEENNAIYSVVTVELAKPKLIANMAEQGIDEDIDELLWDLCPGISFVKWVIRNT